MSTQRKVYLAIDLKSFYASVECMERGLDPLDTNLVVADESRTSKTICLAVSPSLKQYGISGRARLFEVEQEVDRINALRKSKAPGRKFSGRSASASELARHSEYELGYIVATPRMAYYMRYSTYVYNVYLKHVSSEDIHVYSIDEVFIDITPYLGTYKKTPKEMASMILKDVLESTGITATAGIGSNLYLAKIAMDIEAKHMPADENGARIAELTEKSYREKLWSHRPLRDFWRIGKGYEKKLEKYGMYTMGDVARCSIGDSGQFHNEGLLYKLFGVNAELLIDHAWGWEPCTIADIKAYRPRTNSLSSGQVLKRPYKNDEARVVLKEMLDYMALDMVDKNLVCDQVVLTISYDSENLQDESIKKAYKGKYRMDHYGRKAPEHAHGTANLGGYTSSSKKIDEAVTKLYDEITDPLLSIRRINISANHVKAENEDSFEAQYHQMDIFESLGLMEKKSSYEEDKEQYLTDHSEKQGRERNMQEAVLDIRKKYGKNAIIKGINLREEATGLERHQQIGGHKA